jgi:endonuclease YncB( thermonuclease family)
VIGAPSRTPHTARTGTALLLASLFLSTSCQVEWLDPAFPPGIAAFGTPERYPAEGGPAAPFGATEPCTVTRIVDGDTLHCEPVGRIRLIGIDAPEQVQGAFGAQATAALRSVVLEGTEVLLERDVEDRDIYDRALRYVWVDGVMANWLMVRSGHAVLLTYPPNVRYVEAFELAQAKARDRSDGLWATEAFGCRPVEVRRGECR